MINETNTGRLVVPDGNNIFTNNTSLGSSVPAVTTSATSTGNVMFVGNSTVFGAIGKSEPVGPYLLGVTGGANGTTVTFLGPVYDTTTYVSGSGTLNFDARSPLRRAPSSMPPVASRPRREPIPAPWCLAAEVP